MIKKRIPQIPSPRRMLPEQALRSVTSKSGMGVFASSDTLFKDAVFGRDSLEVAEDLLDIKPKLVKAILLTLAALQGEKYDAASEEEPGKIVHEYRSTTVDGKSIDSVSKQIFERLSSQWGGNKNVMAYYGSIDSTPLFIRVLANYCLVYGTGILLETVKLRSGVEASLLEVLDAALDWLNNRLINSKSGLLEYHRLNPRGIENQAWKDSNEFYVHESGQMANHDKPIASIEVQAVAYDALVTAGDLFPSWRTRLQITADQLQKHAIKYFWLPKINYFALGCDYTMHNHRRVLKIKTANPAEMLDSYFFINLDREHKEKFVSAIVREIMGTDFLTDAGIRSRALSESRVIDHWDYHGSFVSWPKETYDISKGLRRHGFPKLSDELNNRILNVTKASRSYPEFVYVDERGRVLGTGVASSRHGELIFVDSRNRPEKIQAWTVSASLAILNQKKQKVSQDEWQKKLESEVLQAIPHVDRLTSPKEVAARYPSYPYVLKGA